MKRIQDFKMASGHGGKREGAGRKTGSATRMNEEARAKAAEGGLMPLDYMLTVLRDEEQPMAARMDAAKAAAPYVHAKLASVEHKGDGGGPLQVIVKQFTIAGD
ncbi:hypothetical protein EVC14_002 [Rhizobium phage RHph_I3_18]|nr:hypothetical protein EVC14_002 [Rhizobium phage RHph_I3_18]